jgi:hypothetical protein
MEKGLKCSVCQHKNDRDRIRRIADVCEYCGHVRCGKCLPDRWPQLADGCCSCLARILKQTQRRVD